MSSKYSTKQYISAQYCDKQTREIWCKNIQAPLRYSNFHVGMFYFASPCISLAQPRVDAFDVSTRRPPSQILHLPWCLTWQWRVWRHSITCFHTRHDWYDVINQIETRQHIDSIVSGLSDHTARRWRGTVVERWSSFVFSFALCVVFIFSLFVGYFVYLLLLSVQCYAMHGQNTNLLVCVCVCLSLCLSHFLSTRLQVRPLNGFLQLIA